MSLRDQLLATGLVSKKRARAVDRSMKAARKKQQGKRRRKHLVEADQAEKLRLVSEAKRLSRAKAKKRREDERLASEHFLRVRQLIQSNRLRHRGPIGFHFKRIDSSYLRCVRVSEAVAYKLRCGELAIAGVREHGIYPEEYAVVSCSAAERLWAIEAELVVFWVRDTRGIGQPEEAFWQPEWEISLVPHRSS